MLILVFDCAYHYESSLATEIPAANEITGMRCDMLMIVRSGTRHLDMCIITWDG